MENLYKKAHEAIRADPEHQKSDKDPSQVTVKRWNAKKLTLEERKARVAAKKKEFWEKLGGGDGEDDE